LDGMHRMRMRIRVRVEQFSLHADRLQYHIYVVDC
jgi:hypothetical protein